MRADSHFVIDSFLTFADKIRIMSGGSPQLQVLQDKNLRYNGGLINMTMLRTINQLGGLTPSARAILSEIENHFGREVLSLSYNKLRLLMQQVSASRSQGGNHSEIVETTEFVLQSLLVALLRKEATVAEFPNDTFSKGRDKPSWIAMSRAQRVVVCHLANIVNNLVHVEPALAQRIKTDVLPFFETPRAYHTTCPPVLPAADEDASWGSGRVRRRQGKQPCG